MALEFLAAEDPQVTDCLRQELARQRGSVELIASENFTSRAVMEAVGSVLPLSSLGLGWVCPAALGLVIGLVIHFLRKQPEAD